jgi:hypothetical protein
MNDDYNPHEPNPYPPQPYPLLKVNPEFWWMNESDRSNAFEARARACLGEGYHRQQDIERGR